MSELTGDVGAMTARLTVGSATAKAPVLATDDHRPEGPGTTLPSSLPAGPTRHLEPTSPATTRLASLLAQARLAGEQLASQPLPISNHQSLLIMKLFGG